MNWSRNLLPVVLATFLVACLAGFYATRNTSARRDSTRQAASGAMASMIDERLMRTARQMATQAETADEQDLAREALRLSDHELDQAFATALREAEALDNSPNAARGAVQQLSNRVAQLKAKMSADGDRVAQLTKQGDTDQSELAKAQLALDQDDLEDAQQDLERSGGDRHARLERALAEHEAAQQGTPAVPKINPPPPVDTLWQQAGYWLALGSKDSSLGDAAEEAAGRASTLERQHNGLESKAPPAASTPADEEEEDTAAMVARLRKLSDLKKTEAELDKRIQDSRQLADVYRRWSVLVDGRRSDALHLVLQSLAAIFGIVLTLVLMHRALLYAIRGHDRPAQHRARVIGTIAAQFIAIVAILLIVFGVPTQLSTMIGLATAGLTVVLKDFIVGFIGWFALMGRSGLRIGDWVEINGVSGEVIEIGVLKTVLLEMGATSGKGHPTGRRVSFSNSYAIEGHYFNFSTAGQWLWDELQVTVPAGRDPYQVVEHIRQTVERETEADAAEAAQDWERVTHQYGVGSFSAKPAVDLRPGLTGLDVTVRYITRAPRRYEVKSRLFRAIVELLHVPASEAKGV
jgi:small-conductance mechanosensitive channel